MPARYSYTIIGQDSLQGAMPPKRSQTLGTTYLVHVSAHSTRPPSCRHLSSLRSLAEGRNSSIQVPHASQGIPFVCSNNMPHRVSTTYGRHISTPIPSAPLVEELCLFMRCVDWFRPASGSSGKRLQLPYPVHLL